MIALRKLLWFLALILTACSSGRDKTLIAETPEQKTATDTIQHKIAMDMASAEISSDSSQRAYINQFLNKKNLTEKGNYYILTKFSDNTLKISWGNDTIKRIYDKPIDFWCLDRIWVKWENQDYIILDYGLGSGVWKNIILPLNKNEQASEFFNGLCFDRDNNLFAIAGRPWNEIGPVYYNDTVLTIKNLKSQQLQFAIEKEKHSGDILNCIDTISIINKTLYYKWEAPSRYDDNKKSIERRIRVTI